MTAAPVFFPHVVILSSAGSILVKGTEFAFLALGAVLGAHAKYKTTESPLLFNTLPADILIANVAGAFMLGTLVVMSSRRSLDSRYSLFAAVGFCGPLATMPSFALEPSDLMDNSRHAAMAVHVPANVGLSIGALAGGKTLMQSVLS